MSARSAASDGAIVGTIGVMGLLAWWMFWGGGEFAMVGHDWPKEAHYLDTLRRALGDLKLPFYTGVDAQGSARFLANPELPLSPQFLLLPLLDNGSFVMIDAMLLWGVGLWGCVRLKHHYRLTGSAVTVLVLLFSFNGHITAHLAVGHSMWVGYFLAPHVLLQLFRLVDGDARPRHAVELGMWLALMMLQGSFHLVIYLGTLLALTGILVPGGLWFVVQAAAVSAILAAVKVVPTLLAFPSPEHGFLSGYPDLSTLLVGLTAIRPVETPYLGSFGDGGLGWWEYDLYVGPLGLLLFVSYGSRTFLTADRGSRALGLACIAVTMLSFGELVWLATQIGVPVLGQERVPARFIVAPLLVLVVATARGWSRDGNRPRWVTAGALMVLSAGLLAHLWRWRLPLVELDLVGAWKLQPITPQPSLLYEWSWLASAMTSMLAWLAALAWLACRRLLGEERPSGEILR